jgi:ABC-2 type transport system permease protein
VAGLGPVVIAIGAIAAALVVAMLQLASRRWRPDSAKLVTAQVLATVFGLLLAVNLGRIAQRQGADGDLSSEGLSSISAASVQIVRGADAPVTIAAFISANLPGDLALKAKEVEDKLKAIERSSAGKVELKLYHPANAFDKAGAAAQQHYGVKPFKTMVDAVGGREVDEVFLGAAVTCAGRSQVIGQFDPGLSVEYELVRAIRSVARAKKPVLGIASTELKMNGDFDFMSGQSRPAWAIVEEWRKQYDVRDVNLDEPVAAEISVLVAVQPSLCTQPQLEHLHDYIWEGRPTLIMEDPLPMFAGPQFAASQPRKPSNPYMQQQEAPAPKADLKPLFGALGVDIASDGVLWSDWNPSHMFRGIPPSVVWCMRSQGSIADSSVSSVTTGIDSLLIPWGGLIYTTEKVDGVPHPTVTALVRPSTNVRWGTSRFSDYFTQNPMNGGLMPTREQPRFRLGDQSRVPALAVRITGTMPSAFPKVPADAAKPVDAKDAKADAKKDDAKPEAKKGVPSSKPINVIMIADTDLAHDQFFQFYRNENNQLGKDEFAVLRNLRNVQFLANAVDALAGDDAFLAVRTRRPQSRPLERLANVLETSDKRLRDEVARAEENAEAAISKAQADFQAKQAAVEKRDDLDETTKMQQKMLIGQSEQRKLDVVIEDINRAKDDSIRAAKAERNAAIDENRWWVRIQAVGIPALVMATIVLVVLINRLRQEIRNIPSSRKRTNP